MDPQTGPAMIIAKIPQKIPTKMTQPRSTFNIVATRTGPGVGGMNACPTAKSCKERDHIVKRGTLCLLLQGRMLTDQNDQSASKNTGM